MSTSANTVRIVSHSAMPTGVRVSQLQPALGSIVSGFKFDGRPPNDAFRSALRDLLHNRGLVIFEPGVVTAENFTAFAGFLGEFFHYAGPHTPRAPENPDATMIDSLKDKNLRNHIWHADGGFRPDAPAFTALFAQLVPGVRAATRFSATRPGSTNNWIRCLPPTLNRSPSFNRPTPPAISPIAISTRRKRPPRGSACLRSKRPSSAFTR